MGNTPPPQKKLASPCRAGAFQRHLQELEAALLNSGRGVPRQNPGALLSSTLPPAPLGAIGSLLLGGQLQPGLTPSPDVGGGGWKWAEGQKDADPHQACNYSPTGALAHET